MSETENNKPSVFDDDSEEEKQTSNTVPEPSVPNPYD